MTTNQVTLDKEAIASNLKRLIIEGLRLEGRTPESIAGDAPLFGSSLGLDSVDALELVVLIEKAYGLRIKSHEVDKSVFASINSLTEFLLSALANPNDGTSAEG